MTFTPFAHASAHHRPFVDIGVSRGRVRAVCNNHDLVLTVFAADQCPEQVVLPFLVSRRGPSRFSLSQCLGYEARNLATVAATGAMVKCALYPAAFQQRQCAVPYAERT